MTDHEPTNRERKLAAERRRMKVEGRGLLTILIRYEAKPPR